MNNLADVVWIEWHKAMRSKVPLFTSVGFLFMPLGIAFIMFIYRYPELSRAAGLLSAKANLLAATADWSTFLNMLTQGTALVGYILFTLIGSWIFGREFSDGTLKDLLALPVSRTTILIAKYIVFAVWCLLLILFGYVLSLIIGTLIVLPPSTPDVLIHSGITLVITALMVLAVVTPAALFASIGRGYLLPIGLALFMLVLANVLAVAGWGGYVPWSIPALYAQFGGSASLEPVSYLIVFLTGVVGIVATYWWWNHADQSR